MIAAPASPMIGILAAMPAEVAKLRENTSEAEDHKFGDVFVFTTGIIGGRRVVFGAANIGMAFAASAATTMINHFRVGAIVFTGVAGGLKEGQRIGDIVLGKDVVNYEMDARQFKKPWDPTYEYQLGEIPLLDWRFFDADPGLLALALEVTPPSGVTVHSGRVASGSVFVGTEQKKGWASTVWEPLGWPDACEMENAGVATICRAYSVPYLSLRALSDVVEGDVNDDFNAFCQRAADSLFPFVLHVVKNCDVKSRDA